MVGTEAETVTDIKKPTMVLSLNGHHAEMQESLVVHEFGHALGLEHEHQRSDFWDVLTPYVDMEKMKQDPLVNPGGNSDGGQSFGKNWEKVSRDGEKTAEYDPESIMHYW